MKRSFRNIWREERKFQKWEVKGENLKTTQNAKYNLQ